MPHHESKRCPRCFTDFECKSGAVWQCQCSQVTLSAAQLDYIHNRYDDCLCYKCLADLRAEYNIMLHRKQIQYIVSGWQKKLG